MIGLSPSESSREIEIRRLHAVDNARSLFDRVAEDVGLRLPYLFTEGNVADLRQLRLHICLTCPEGQTVFSSSIRMNV